MTLITSPVFVPEAQLKKAGNFHALFGNKNPLALEIGCGIGDFIVQIAARYPERNFIAIDIFNQGCRQTCRRIEDSGLTNILMMRIEARYLMYEYLGKESLQAIYINCPDPWPKKRQRKRRLLNHDFLNLALYCLQDHGELNFCTDFIDYGESAANLLRRTAPRKPSSGTVLPLSGRLPGFQVHAAVPRPWSPHLPLSLSQKSGDPYRTTRVEQRVPASLA
jgi:tRNA (guanine-N7-)-methyltransferase